MTVSNNGIGDPSLLILRENCTLTVEPSKTGRNFRNLKNGIISKTPMFANMVTYGELMTVERAITNQPIMEKLRMLILQTNLTLFLG